MAHLFSLSASGREQKKESPKEKSRLAPRIAPGAYRRYRFLHLGRWRDQILKKTAELLFRFSAQKFPVNYTQLDRSSQSAFNEAYNFVTSWLEVLWQMRMLPVEMIQERHRDKGRLRKVCKGSSIARSRTDRQARRSRISSTARGLATRCTSY